MPGTTSHPDIELIIEDVGGGGGLFPPAHDDGGGDEGNRDRRRSTPARYFVGIAVAMIAILIFFMALATVFLVSRGSKGGGWHPVQVPNLMLVNTSVLLASSVTIELARKRLADSDAAGFRRLWTATIALGGIFLAGQVVAWRQLAAQGIYLASNRASSFFYIFTGAHAVHLLGGFLALIYVGRRHFVKGNATQAVAVEVTSYYWHFMDALWVFLLAVLYFGK